MNNIPLILLGVLAPFAAFVNPSIFFLVVLAIFLTGDFRGALRDLQKVYPYLVLVLAWLVAQAIVAVWATGPASTIAELCNGFICSKAIVAVAGSLREMKVPILQALSYTSFFALIAMLGRSWERVVYFRNALLWSSLLAAVVCVFGYMGIIDLPNGRYWREIGRPSGTFTDPNSLGIGAYLLIVFFLQELKERSGKFRSIAAIGVGLWIVVGMLSGSRAFILGAVVLTVFVAGRMSRRLVAGMLVIFLLSTLIFNLMPKETREVFTSNLPTSLSRVVRTLDVSHATGELNSRSIFFDANFQMWKQAPFLGVGWGNFQREFRSIRAERDYNVGGWNDNPNSFYLGVLSELGLIGLISMLVAATAFRIRPPAEEVPLGGAIGFLAQLLIGAHLYFPEIAAISALIFSQAFVLTHSMNFWRELKTFSGVAALIVFAKTFLMDFGVFNRFAASQPWVSRRSAITLPCPESGEIKIGLLVPSEMSRQMRLNVSSSNGEVQSLQMKQDGTMQGIFRCDPLIGGSVASLVRFQLECSHIWIAERKSSSRYSDMVLCGRLVTTPNYKA